MQRKKTNKKEHSLPYLPPERSGAVPPNPLLANNRKENIMKKNKRNDEQQNVTLNNKYVTLNSFRGP